MNGNNMRVLACNTDMERTVLAPCHSAGPKHQEIDVVGQGVVSMLLPPVHYSPGLLMVPPRVSYCVCMLHTELFLLQ